MSAWKDDTWVNGKKEITGKWIYNWPSDSFSIVLNSKDKITGQPRSIVTSNDTPEWGKWKLKRNINSVKD